MKKLLVVASFAAFAAYPAAACDWNCEASTQDKVVATTTEQTPLATPASPPTSVAAAESARKPAAEPVPVVLVTDRH